MKRILIGLMFALLTVPAFAASGVLTTSASTCASSGVTCLIVPLTMDKGSAGLTISGTWTGTITFEGSADGGVSWTAIDAWPLGSRTAVTTTTAVGQWQFNVAGLTTIRARASATISGAATVTISPSYAALGL